MNTTNPGIFIPLIHSLSELVYIDSPAEYQKLFAAAQEKISAALQEISVEHFVFPACRICLDDKTGQPDFYQGLSVFLRRPHQIEYVKAMPAIKKALAYPDIFAEDAYTVPLQNVPAPGFGQISKSVFCPVKETVSLSMFKTHLTLLANLLKQLYGCSGLKASLSLVLKDDGLEIHGISPVALNANHLAWQQHLGKALRRNNYDPRFYSTWSTNGELDAYYRRKNKERQEKMERDYIEKITARNAE